MPIGQAINFIGNTIQGAANRKAAQINTDKTIQANKEMSEYAYSKDLEMWNKSNQYNRKQWEDQNTYNSPSAQMQRYKDAGLNPNLIYGTGTTSAGNTSLPSTSQTAKYQAPRQDYNYKPQQIGMAISQYQDTRMKSAQIDNIKEHTETQKLENQLRVGSITSQFAILKAQAKYAKNSAALKKLEQLEKGWIWSMGITQDKHLYELSKSQYQSQQAGTEAALSEWKAGLSKEGMSPTDPWWQRQLKNKWGTIGDWINQFRNVTPMNYPGYNN